jgi:hypothetical protein
MQAKKESCTGTKNKKSFAPDRDDLPNDTYDNYTGAELTLQQGDQVTTE